jgi:hypothetical protein
MKLFPKTKKKLQVKLSWQLNAFPVSLMVSQCFLQLIKVGLLIGNKCKQLQILEGRYCV